MIQPIRVAYSYQRWRLSSPPGGSQCDATHPLNATIHRAPDIGSLRCAKSRDGSHISVRVFGKYPPMLPAMPFVKPRDLRRKEDLRGILEFEIIVRTGVTYETLLLFLPSM